MAKENKVNSKIPIPVDPLSSLSENTQKRVTSMKTDRHPLETIYKGPINLKKVVLIHRKHLKRSNNATNKIDARHVTIRQKSDDLDWNYKVFNDIPDDDNNKGTLQDHKDNRVGESSKVSTPALKSLLEPCRVRNIKRSLKRPHSRELQGISPAVSDDKGEEKHRRKLIFTDRSEDRWQPTNFWLSSYAASLNQNYGPDLFNYLMKKETNQKVPKLSNTTRACIMNWLVKINGPGGNPAAVQTAAWYFDTVLTVAHTTLENLQVLAAACYWIALKIQGNVISSNKLVKAAANAFSVKVLISAERAVMDKLKFPTQPIVAQDFIAYMSWACDASNFEEIESAATLMYMAGLVVNKDLSMHYPSQLAGAALKNALRVLHKEELLVKLKTDAIYKEALEKGTSLDFLSSLQRWALRRMSSPGYEYRTLIDKAQNRILTEKILTYANKHL